MPKDKSHIKPIALSFKGLAVAWDCSVNTARAIVKENSWMRVIKLFGSRRVVPYEDAEEYIRRCEVVGSSDDSGKMRSVRAAAAANRAKKATKRTKPAAAPAPIATEEATTA